jgi:ferredoxin
MEETKEGKKRKVFRIEIDTKACIGCGTCVVLAPQAFDINNEGYSSVKDTWKDVDDATLIDVAKSCPSGAVILFDEEGNKIKL